MFVVFSTFEKYLSFSNFFHNFFDNFVITSEDDCTTYHNKNEIKLVIITSTFKTSDKFI
jgi:hypothetical protein